MSIRNDEFVDFLETYLMEEEAKELEVVITGDEEVDAPMINSREKANYFLKLMMNIQTDIDDINSICDSEIKKTTERVETFRDNQLRSLVKQYDYYKKILQNFTEHEIANSKKKSVSLAYGTLSIKNPPVKWEYDEEVLLNWAKENAPDLVTVKTTESINKASLKSTVDDKSSEIIKLNGTPIEGVTTVKQEPKFDIKIK